MKASFTTTIVKDDVKNATGLQVPPEAIAALGTKKTPPVKVTIGGYTYPSTVAVMGGVFMIPLSQSHREAAGVKPGNQIEVTLELDLEPRLAAIPDDLAAALAAKPGATEAFEALSPSRRKEFVRQVTEAKAAETRTRRIVGIVAQMGEA